MKYLGFGVNAYSRLGRRIGPGTQNVLSNGVLNSRLWLATARAELSYARNHLEPISVINNPTGATRMLNVRRAAYEVLHAPDDTTQLGVVLARASHVLAAISAGFDNGYDIVDIDNVSRLGDQFGGDTGGYVSRDVIGDGRGRIHLNFKFLRRLQRISPGGGARIAAWTLVHEASHKWALTNDYAYAEQPRFHNLTWQRSVRNADSIAGFVYLVANPDKLDAVDWPTPPYLW